MLHELRFAPRFWLSTNRLAKASTLCGLPLPLDGLELDSSSRSPASLAEHALRWLRAQPDWTQREAIQEASPLASVRMHA